MYRNSMLYNINHIHLHSVFHGIRFKVNKDWVSGIDTLLFLLYILPSIPYIISFVERKSRTELVFLLVSLYICIYYMIQNIKS